LRSTLFLAEHTLDFRRYAVLMGVANLLQDHGGFEWTPGTVGFQETVQTTGEGGGVVPGFGDRQKRLGDVTVPELDEESRLGGRPEPSAAAVKAAVDKEKEDAAAQRAAGDVVVERLQGPPPDLTHDVAAKTLKFDTFGTFAAPEALAESGVLYYEVTVLEGSEGIPQIGFSLKDGIERGDGNVGNGCGDKASSWALDGTRCMKWFEGETSEFACKWEPGDVIGLAANVTAGKLAVSKNGVWTVVLEDEKIKQGVFPCLTAAEYYMRYAFKDFQHAPPAEAVWTAKTEAT